MQRQTDKVLLIDRDSCKAQTVVETNRQRCRDKQTKMQRQTEKVVKKDRDSCKGISQLQRQQTKL